ncbi:hypothetical protein HYC85_003301 [Camellia sinensis]|uniref:Uncharacterized protein n=1 Tax=Camellia sinensis TaxID=4442 RepID=A0A7J7IAY2_CAMSI|nr:hypothetical protein HYC85_003301 [Camellia sinensis]
MPSALEMLENLVTLAIEPAATEAGETFQPSLEYVEVSGDVKNPEDVPEKMFYMEEEAVFGMLGLLANMAKGLMLPPHSPHSAGGDWYEGDDVEFGADMFWLCGKRYF